MIVAERSGVRMNNTKKGVLFSSSLLPNFICRVEHMPKDTGKKIGYTKKVSCRTLPHVHRLRL